MDARRTSSRSSATGYRHADVDIRDRDGHDAGCSRRTARDIALVIHAAAQPSHDWAAREPFTDFDVNAVGTLNVLEATRQHCPEAPFIFTSTNKVYGDTPNRLPLVEHETALGDRPRAHLRRRHPRGHVDRPHACTASSAPPRSPPT